MKTLEDRITSLRAITIPMLLVNSAIASLLSSLLLDVLGVNIIALHYLASFTLAIGIGWTVLDTSVHSYLVHKSIPVIFAICSCFLLLIKFKVFKESVEHYSWYVTRIFLALMVAAVEYTFSHLFIKKYKEDKKHQGIDLEELTNSLKETIERLKETEIRLEKTQDRLDQTQDRLDQTEEKLAHVKAHFYCRHCEEEFDNPNACKSHEASCPDNMKN